jgi:hypothetical protein
MRNRAGRDTARGGLLPLRRAASERNALHGVSREDADAQKKKDARESGIHPHLQ